MKKIFIFIIIILLSWIGFNIFYSKNFIFDGTEESLSRIMFTLPINEQTNFLNDFELVANSRGGEDKLIGFEAKEIKDEAVNVKRWLNTQNIVFLEEFINKLSKSKQSNSSLHIIKFGKIYPPQTGYIYDKSYSIEELDIMLKKFKDTN